MLILLLSLVNSLNKLYTTLLSPDRYNRFSRPPDVNSTKLKLGLKLVQILNIDEKNQIIKLNVWLKQNWIDKRLRWNKMDFGGIDHIYVPTDQIWLPDIVLYNNAEGNYEIAIKTKALVYFNGSVFWEPPALYKSSCPINVRNFPLDQQECFLKFGSWTYNGYEVDLQHISGSEDKIIKDGIDLSVFYQNVQWDVLSVPAKRYENYFSCCEEPYPWILFKLNLRRKTKFYTINMIIPCLFISFLTALVFCLPSDSGEKITLSVSILLTLTVFILQFIEIIPPTSVVVPLIGRYVLFTICLVTLSLIMTIIVLSINFRSQSTHRIPQWTRKCFIDFFPKFLFMGKPEQLKYSWKKIPSKSGNPGDCIANLHYIADCFKTRERKSFIREEWKYIAMVIDRILMWIFLVSCIVGTLTILLSSKSNQQWDSF